VAAVFVGAVTSIKWSGAFVLFPATLAVVLLKRVPWTTLFWFALSPIVHLLIWMAGLRLMGHPSDIVAVKDVILNALRTLHATGLHDNALASPWYTWPVLYHPIVVKLSLSGVIYRYASSAGNVVLWFPASLLVVLLPLARGVAAVRAPWRRVWAQRFDSTFSHAVLVLAVGWVAMLLLFIVSMGKHSFFYHYMPSYGFALVLLAGCAAKLGRAKPVGLLVFIALAAAVAVYFVPVWGEFPLSQEVAYQYWLFLKPWQP
jgi:dolichyl-phosphate-mannose--protein O-mannosyl transferase